MEAMKIKTCLVSLLGDGGHSMKFVWWVDGADYGLLR